MAQSPDSSLEHDLADWSQLWHNLYPRLIALVTARGTIRDQDELARFAVDVQRIAALPQRLRQRQNDRRDTGDIPAPRNPAILIVEDEPDILLILQRVIRDLAGGYDIIPLQSAQEAIERLAQQPTALIITDYMLPGMNGLQLTEAVKQTSPDTYVVLITAYATSELENKARAARVNHFFPKPFPLAEFETVVRRALEISSVR